MDYLHLKSRWFETFEQLNIPVSFSNSLKKLPDHDAFLVHLISCIDYLKRSEEDKDQIVMALMSLKYAIDLNILYSQGKLEQTDHFILWSDYLSACYYQKLTRLNLIDLVQMLQTPVESIYLQLASDHEGEALSSWGILETVQKYIKINELTLSEVEDGDT
ncbi:hypothetical protein SAMN05421734_102426 [Pelagirhabdus alkalitolerans]|uniref:Uncharacterized protein n=1 Tax=Pelagirhabdus alkalitolerans TaxID=1612202 RepID=A0A1G6HAU1_9BACI|nr:hypothetical protein [Pelagirhabdus alkalitolerans]SDB91331.1 hypothetical protein SAMN05421734_102426 [Pelagirhabdus alkalitolerans]